MAAVLGVSTGVLATKLGWLHKELEQQGVTEQEAVQMVVTEPDSTAENVEDVTSYHITPKGLEPVMLSVAQKRILMAAVSAFLEILPGRWRIIRSAAVTMRQ